jgi:glucose/mannose-6-phosphate isomerase
MTDHLDDPAVYEGLDPEGVLGRIRELPHQCREAWEQARTFKVPSPYWKVENLVLVGMGGSAIAGDLLRSLAAHRSRKAVFVCRGYEVPSLVDENTLVVASSYSGETEETLAAFSQALRGPAKKLVITTGGRLAGLAREYDIPLFLFDYQGEPRSALGYSLMPLLSVAEQVGVLQEMEAEVAEAVALMGELVQELDSRVAVEQNPAKRLAERLQTKVPIVYGAESLAEVAHRWKTQLNENSKVWAFYEELPEANHNAIAGYPLPREAIDRLHVVLLYHPVLHPRIILRYDATKDALSNAGVGYDVVEVKGSGPLSQMLTGILYGDFVSYYLAILNAVSPSPVAAIGELKRRLAEAPWPQ